MSAVSCIEVTSEGNKIPGSTEGSSLARLWVLAQLSTSPMGSMPGDTWTEAGQAQGDCRSPSPFWCRWCRQGRRVLNRALRWLGQESGHMESRSPPATVHAGPAVQPEKLAVTSWRLLAIVEFHLIHRDERAVPRRDGQASPGPWVALSLAVSVRLERLPFELSFNNCGHWTLQPGREM
jgi:hypothetical protein